jgi:D-amino-acid dehydrogenase
MDGTCICAGWWHYFKRGKPICLDRPKAEGSGEGSVMAKQIIVVGGGIVGVCSALQLQRDGHQVRLIDAKKPGRETSYGNAGVFAEASIVVMNNPGLLRALPKLLLSRSNGLRFNPVFVLKRLPWMLKFLSYCRASHMHHAARALRQLLTVSLAEHKRLIAAANVDHLLRQGGWLKVFRHESSFAKFAAELDVLRSNGARFTVYEREQIRQIEPGLKPIYCKAVLMDDTCTVSSPADLTDAYVTLFEAAGGILEEAKVTGISVDDTGWHVRAGAASFHGDDVVLAAGAWSAEIASWLGYKIPMVWERGYHQHLAPADAPPLQRPVHDIDGSFVIAPMRQGLRVTSGVEITDRDAPPNYQQITRSVAAARQAHEMREPIEDQPWMGRRPTLVDSLPMIGAAPRHKGLWFNFGHQHLGLSMAPGSAKLLAALMAGAALPVDDAPFRATRFRI